MAAKKTAGIDMKQNYVTVTLCITNRFTLYYSHSLATVIQLWRTNKQLRQAQCARRITVRWRALQDVERSADREDPFATDRAYLNITTTMCSYSQ